MGISIANLRNKQQVTENAIKPETKPIHRANKIMFTVVSNVIGKQSKNVAERVT